MFHLLLITLIVIASIRWGEWNRWRDLLPTIYYVTLFDLYYLYISASIDILWKIENPLISKFITDSLYAFIFLPCLTVLFLSYFPETTTGKISYYLKFIIVSLIIETIALNTNNISFEKGWHLGWEAFFYPVMYLMMRLHYLKPKQALILSGLVIAFLLTVFQYNIF